MTGAFGLRRPELLERHLAARIPVTRRDRGIIQSPIVGFRIAARITRPDGTVEVVPGDNMAGAFLNSLAVAIPSTVIPILIAAFAAYAFAWMNFPGRRLLFILVVALLFGLIHHRWLAGFCCGLVYGALLLRNRDIWAAGIAHATTNLLLGIYVVWAEKYEFWS